MMFVVIAMFVKGVEVLGPSNTNKDVLYEGPIKSTKELNGLNIDFSKEYILEKLVKLKKEISVIITRFGNNRYEIYEAIENIHENQILKKSKIPADISNKLVDQSREWSKQISEELKYIGTLCVEFFIDRNDNLYVNEIAPRVHNSGHLTINAFNVSQFENHVRAVCGLEQIPLKKLSNAKMINIIGNQITNYRNKNFIKNRKNGKIFFHYFIVLKIFSILEVGFLNIWK